MYIKMSSPYKDICVREKRLNDIFRKENRMPDGLKPVPHLGYVSLPT